MIALSMFLAGAAIAAATAVPQEFAAWLWLSALALMVLSLIAAATAWVLPVTGRADDRG